MPLCHYCLTFSAARWMSNNFKALSSGFKSKEGYQMLFRRFFDNFTLNAYSGVMQA